MYCEIYTLICNLKLALFDKYRILVAMVNIMLKLFPV